MKTIVLGYDDSPQATRAVHRTVSLAKALGAKVIVASVAPILIPAGRGIGPYDPVDPPERHRELAERGAEILEEHGIEAEAIEALGDAADVIVRISDEHDADLVVVGATHHMHLARLLGSVSDDVAHHAHCDVLLVR